ncbi:hypothetical protein DPMN_056437 [Dreissena polymorpha]|uniref:Secreted protein n=1 Tax=Dreissena polymorpha TaxID=45954 RepID=A0A9D4HT63_DREPO|nr:hypothetical protein DPMN_056437 [Dreissena polymorpha]
MSLCSPRPKVIILFTLSATFCTPSWVAVPNSELLRSPMKASGALRLNTLSRLLVVRSKAAMVSVALRLSLSSLDCSCSWTVFRTDVLGSNVARIVAPSSTNCSGTSKL